LDFLISFIRQHEDVKSQTCKGAESLIVHFF